MRRTGLWQGAVTEEGQGGGAACGTVDAGFGWASLAPAAGLLPPGPLAQYLT